MLISDQLENEELFSVNEYSVAQYLLHHSSEIHDMNIVQLARNSYTSPATVVRVCKKLGYNGFKELKQAYMEEIEYIHFNFENVDPNIPFQKYDSLQDIAKNICSLLSNSILDTYSLLDDKELNKAFSLLIHAKHIQIFGFTLAAAPAYDFKRKMEQIGKRVTVTENIDDMYQAFLYPEANTVTIAISYSGETRELVNIIQKMKQKSSPVIAITSIGDNTLSKISDCVIHISTREKLTNKIATYTSSVSIHYVLDVFYSMIFARNYDENLEMKTNNAKYLDRERSSNVSILKDTEKTTD